MADEGAVVPLAGRHPGNHFLHLLRLDQLFQFGDQLLGIEGLDDIVLCPLLQRGDRVGNLPMGAHHDDRQVQPFAPSPFDQLQAVHAGHFQIDQHGVVGAFLQHPLGRKPVFRANALDSFDLQVLLQQAEDIFLVVDNQHHHKVSLLQVGRNDHFGDSASPFPVGKGQLAPAGLDKLAADGKPDA